MKRNENKIWMSVVALIAFTASILLYTAQLAFFTHWFEQFVYGFYGFFWFGALYRMRNIFTGRVNIFLISIISAFGLGFSPHRLRIPNLEGLEVISPFEEGIFLLLLFPVAHFVLTAAFLMVTRKD